MKFFRSRNIFFRLMRILVLVYLVSLALVFIYQRKLIYVPSRASLKDLTAHAAGFHFEVWTNLSGAPIGWKKPALRQPAQGRLLILHGNGGTANYVLEDATELTELENWDTYVLEYPGYGARPGSPNEIDIFAAACEGFELLKTNGPVHLLGISLGTGVSCYLAGKYGADVRGVLLVAPYDNLTSVGWLRMPMFPVNLMLRDRFTSDEYLQNYHGPVGMMFAGRDRVIPERIGHKLFEKYQGPKKSWEFPDDGHNDMLPQPAAFWREVSNFWLLNLAESGKADRPN